MRAVAVNFENHQVELRDIPGAGAPGAGEVLFQIRQVGICGTDREIAAVRLVLPPAGDSFLTIGHEALGQVVETGRSVSNLRRGDWVVPMVRRPCHVQCKPCANGRADLCASGEYVERGIVRLHGYFTEFAVDDSAYLLRVPDELLEHAILLEPLSAVEKAVDTAARAHLEFFEYDPPRALVLGAGTIGILSALALQCRGYDVAVCSLEARSSPRATMLESAGIRYMTIDESWVADVVIEATGSADALAVGARMLGRNGVLVTLGAPNATVAFPFRDLIIKNQALIGSVNASPESFAQGLRDLARFDARVLGRMVHRVAFDDYEQTLTGRLSPHPKIVHMLE